MEQNWEEFFKSRGIKESYIELYLQYIKSIDKNDLPVIFEIEHLSHMIGIKYPEINSLIYGTKNFYRNFKIPKRNGGVRIIDSPYPSLMKCQRWIYTNILLKLSVHHCAYAYKKDTSIVKNASQHLGNECILKIDITDFFSSIKINWVINLFSRLGYSKKISFSLAALCCLHNKLPQGAVTSPCLSNILLYSLDERLFRLSVKLKLKYTRYADDIVFSGDNIHPNTIIYIRSIIDSFGFSINERKTKLLNNKKRKIITGIDISNNNLSLPRKTKRELRKSFHYINKFGLIGHMNSLKIKNPNYIQSLEGKVRFWLQIEPDNKEALDYLFLLKKLNLLTI